jgi:dTDP-D-glucose 4,6-dehydratase
MIVQGVGVLILVTGSAGCIGSRLCHCRASETDNLVVNVDKLPHAGNLDSWRTIGEHV